MKKLLVLLLLCWAMPAWAAHAVNLVVYDPANGQIRLVVVPDDDSELNDPALNIPGMQKLLVPVATYQAFTGPHDLMVAIATDWMQRGPMVTPQWVLDALAPVIPPVIMINPIPGLC
jgi:hypothetical protein